jgi:hypothetical protein
MEPGQIIPIRSTEDLLIERGSTHGDFTDNADISQRIKKVMRSGKNWDALPDVHKEALEMIAHKIARWLSGDYRNEENPADTAGYARLVQERINN